MVWLTFLSYLNTNFQKGRVWKSLFIHSLASGEISVLIYCYKYFLRNFQRNLTRPFGIPKQSFFYYLTLIALVQFESFPLILKRQGPSPAHMSTA